MCRLTLFATPCYSPFVETGLLDGIKGTVGQMYGFGRECIDSHFCFFVCAI